MGWKEFYKIDQRQFQQMYDQSQPWGDLYPFRVSTASKVYYGAGAYTRDTTFKLTPKIAHPVGIKTRITIKYLFLAVQNAPAGSNSEIGIVFYKNDETSKDPGGYDYHGVRITITTPPSYNYVEEKTLVVEQDNNKIVVKHEQGSADYQLEAPLSSFKLAIKVDNYTGIVIYEVIGEYYDQFEDMFSMMFNIMIVVMFIMMGVSFVSMIIRAFRGRKEEAGE